ncbi:Trypsin [Popillia japonica]|uniref:Trypsin n=1 Tax=Popillia japonica TaxID=7064 RepID=A0AAW1NIF6_POPJA
MFKINLVVFLVIFGLSAKCLVATPVKGANITRQSRFFDSNDLGRAAKCGCVCGMNNRKIRILGGEISQTHEFPWLAGLYENGKLNNRKIRILGGEISQTHEFPWLAGLYENGKFYCGATLITKKHVLTAAHCVKGFNMHSIRVVLADHDRESPDRLSTIQVRNLVDMIPHKRYDSTTFNNDIAILELDQPVEFDERIQPLCLPQSAYNDYTGVPAVVAGWGKTGEKVDTSRVLRKVVVPVWSKEECYASEYGRAKLSDNMFCAGYPEGEKDACRGDSGGPLQMKVESGYMELIGKKKRRGEGRLPR